MSTTKPPVCVVAAILILALGAMSHGSQTVWPQFRGPGGLGIAPDNKTYPVELDTARNLLWKTKVSKGHSSPCIWANSIFITARSGKVLETICIDRGNGKIKWRKSVEPETTEKISSSNSHASPTPVCDGKRVYVYFGSYGLLAYDVDGKELWKKPLPIPNHMHGSAASPILANQMVLINCDEDKQPYLLAVDRDTGKTIWRQDRQVSRAGWSTPVLWKHGKKEELIVLGCQQLISYDLKDGQKRWWLPGLPYVTASTPVYADETLFAAATAPMTGDPVNPIELPDFNELMDRYDSDGNNRLTQAEVPEDFAVIYRFGPQLAGLKKGFSRCDTDKDGAISEEEWKQFTKQIATIKPRMMDALVAIRSGGKGDVSQSHIKWSANVGVGQVPSPLVYRGRIYLVKHGGIVTCFNAETGDRIYSEKLGPRVYYNASPVAADDKIYVCSYLGTVFVIQAGDTFKVLSRNKLGERINATPALVEGAIYVRTAGHLMAFRN
ncbi:MAG: outer membrane protein assembly factor BamB family protein [Planctomycetota bacterium]